jgi:tetratricopeptide (TPR) repeat protein
LLAQGLVGERYGNENLAAEGSIFYDFTYENLRALILEETSQTRQRLLHRRVAEALLGQVKSTREGAAQPHPKAAAIAAHLRAAGDTNRAADYFRQAGDYARSVFANHEALVHYRAALDTGHRDTGELFEAVGDLLTLLGEYRQALEHYEKAAAALVASPERARRQNSELARLEHKQGSVHHRRGEWEQAVAHFEEALRNLGGEEGHISLWARIYADWSRTAHHQGEEKQASELAGRAADLAASVNDDRALSQAYNMLGILARGRGDNQEAIGYLEKSLQIARSLRDLPSEAAALNNLSLAYASRGSLRQAVELAQEALELCNRLGDRHRAAALYNNLADLHHAAGDPGLAMEYLKKAVVIFAEIGMEAGERKAETWKLTEW